ncbi:MAG: DUF1804 family protein [Magnetococcales bacterium]|nr:DUF1804 family protein [Magnetococcales bacterium]
MAHTSKTRSKLRRRFIEGGDLAVVAERLGVAIATARRWRREALKSGDDWQQARDAFLLAGKGRRSTMRQGVEKYMGVYLKAVEALEAADDLEPLERTDALAKLADSFNKITGSVAKLDAKLATLGVAMETVEKLGDFIKSDFPQHAGAFLEVLEPFGERLAKDHG